MDYDDYQVASAPAWLAGENGSLWNRCLGMMKDAFRQAAMTAVFQRFVDFAHVSSLASLLAEKNLPPAWNETESSVRQRIRDAWITWDLSGTVQAIEAALQQAGYTTFQVVTAAGDGSLNWWEFDVYIYQPFPWAETFLADGTWGDGGIWEDGGSWAGDMPEDALTRLRVLIRKWKALHSSCRYLVVVHGTTADLTWDSLPGATWDDDPFATWDTPTSYLTV
jgi:hypothetical protein